MKFLLILALCAGCTSATLSDTETIAALTAAQAPGAGYGSFRFGQPSSEFSGLDTISIGPEGLACSRPSDSLAFGIVPITDAIYVFKSGGGFSQVSVSAIGFTDGNKLHGCVEQLYGPLERKGLTDYSGRRGQTVALLTRDYSGNASLLLVNAKPNEL